ncbi:MAG: hypothetical protein LBT89_03275 [Planctomycetaceae bacterium]|jgi:hypothetical protein|nr:hypothetical protein [Planctomycetaceae bacterium]
MPASPLLRLCAAIFAALFLAAAVFAQAKKEESAADPFDAWKTNLTNLTRLSQKTVKDFTAKTETEKTNDFTALGKLVADKDKKLPPAVRYVAVLTIGQLNEKDAPSPQPPVPYSPSITYLTEQYKKKNTPDYVKYGALLGLVRCAYSNIEPPQKRSIQKLFLDILAKKPVENDDEVADWWQQTALEGLSGLKMYSQEVADAVLAIMKDEDRSLEIRSKAAKVFGDLDYKDTKFDGKKIVESLQTFVQSVWETELKKIDESPGEQKKKLDEERTLKTKNKTPEQRRKEREESEAEFTALPKDQQLLIEEVITESKMALQCVLYAVTCDEKDFTSGLIGAFPAEAPERDKLSGTITKIQTIFKTFDEGTSGKDKKKASSTGTSSARSNRDEREQGGGAGRAAAKTDEKKTFKINLVQLKKILAVKPQEAKDAAEEEEDAEN